MVDNTVAIWAGVTIKDGEEEMDMNKAAYGGRAFLIDSR